MRFTVVHRTRYAYSGPVRLGPHLLRLTPRPERVGQVDHQLLIDPEPVDRWQEVDDNGNLVTRLIFEGQTRHLSIESRFALDTPALPALVTDMPPLPWPGQGAPVAPTVAAFSDALAAEAGGQAAGFLDRLNTTLYTRIDRRIRPTGAAHTPEHTLESGRGACRDLAVLFIAAARAQGMQARFVSGYQACSETPDGRRYLHAWPEVHLPGLGWRGFDPTHGTRVEEGHVSLAAAPDQAGTMPVEGGFTAGPVTSTLDFDLRIETDT
ncbi:Protein containing transglutaminase-like domain, putative cysteine protease [Rhodovulum sp. P5]|uniref:transglutaminase family protein n=1 Tax=Rhodovulum sp. P5 TaxID=1564506 RepID=UPI0009C2C6CB|nr:transglutaminase family protein [Rhodovulum sp. P5]ARE40738.1 Protein containing transglutaminase-like domain, putative cysteine protease [Rhodovulum sp. P5]